MTTSEYAAIALVVACCVVAIARFELFCLRDLAKRSDYELSHLTRAGWTLVIACVIPIGGICYLCYGRPR